jgi:hypothetical protein
VTNRVTNPEPKEEPMTITESTTETVTIYPEVKIQTSHRAELAEAHALADDLLPKVEHLGELVKMLRGVNDEAVLACAAAGLPINDDETLDRVGAVTGWLPLWEMVSAMTEALGGDPMSTTGLTASAHERGAPDHPFGTRALITLPDGSEVVEMTVISRPTLWKGVEGEHYRMAVVEGEGVYLASHDEITAGVERLGEAS